MEAGARGRRDVERPVDRGPAPAQVVVVHARQIVVDQRVGVHHLDRGGEPAMPSVPAAPPMASYAANTSVARSRFPSLSTL